MKLDDVEEATFDCLSKVIRHGDVFSLAGADAQAQAGLGLAILALAKAIDRWAQAAEKELEAKGWPIHKSG